MRHFLDPHLFCFFFFLFYSRRCNYRVAIRAYFDEHGLVRQQLDSFDEFITNTILEIVEDTRPFDIKPQPLYGPGQSVGDVSIQTTLCLWPKGSSFMTNHSSRVSADVVHTYVSFDSFLLPSPFCSFSPCFRSIATFRNKIW